MPITASELRTNIFKLLDKVLETGHPLEIVRKGRMLRIVPADPPSKLERLVRRDDYIAEDVDPGDLVHMDWSGEWKP